MWHASVSPIGGFLPEATLAAACAHALRGVGDASRGEWVEINRPNYYHLRRRLSEKEELVTGPAVDVRGTPEQAERVERLKGLLSPESVATYERMGLLWD